MSSSENSSTNVTPSQLPIPSPIDPPLQSSSFLTLLGVLITNIIVIMVVFGKLTATQASDLSTAMNNLVGAIVSLVVLMGNLFGWSWYSHRRSMLKAKHIEANRDVLLKSVSSAPDVLVTGDTNIDIPPKTIGRNS
jgi:hypothetical protein